jgi:uncharacterized protein with HEPN domain
MANARDLVRLREMLDAAKKVITFSDGRRRSDLDDDEMYALAVVRLLEIIGEAAKGVSESTRSLHTDIPWSQIAGTRDRLIHGYFDIDHDIVWAIITQDLPPLVTKLEAILSAESS